MPAVYEKDVRVVRGPSVNNIKEVAPFESIYTDIAEEGEWVGAFGKLEKVLDKKYDRERRRIVIGSFEANGRD